MDESEDRAKAKYLELERELEEKTEFYESSIRENQQKSEE